MRKSNCLIAWVLVSVASAEMGRTGAAAQENGGQPGIHPNQAIPTRIVPLDGSNWLLAVDPKDVGRQEKWYEKPQPDALPTRVPWVIQDAFPDYHGVAWYWRDFTAPGNPHPAGRYVLRFRAVDYRAEIWVNDVPIGLHEGLEEPFEFDVTSAIKPESSNRLAVRVLNPTDVPIDGMRITEVPVGRRENGTPRDNAYNTGGIIDSVELLASPSVRVEDLQVVPDWKTGAIRVRARVRNSGDKPVPAQVQWTVAPAAGGESTVAGMCGQDLVAGATLVETQLRVPHHRSWELNDPYLYRVTVNVRARGTPSVDERSVRCGFRDFRFEDGYFRLNGRRIRLHGGLYTALQYPVSMSVPHDEEWVRRDVLNMKVMGFNIARITCGAALPARQLDLFDELGLLVCEEHFGADSADSKKRMAETAQLEQRWDRSIAAVIRRDRNHPSIVLWSLLNEVKDGRLFRHVVQSLPLIRELDDSRMILLNSGRFDGDNRVGSWSSPGSLVWEQINLRDVHDYPTFPHSAEAIRRMRGLQGGGASPMLLSEYGVCGAQDYARFTRHFEQLGKEHVADARIYKACLDRFMDDWKKWRLDECWARPEDYFLDSQRNQAKLALDDYNAWMSNPTLIGDFTSTQIVDAWYHGCGITSYFREPKPGMADAYQDMAAKVRFCLFVEPVNVYRGTKVRLEAVLINLDALQPGKYPVSLQVVGPKQKRLLQKTIAIEIPQIRGRPEPPFAQPVFAEDLAVDGPSGKYRFLATFEHGAAAGGGDVEMYVGDPADMPAVTTEVTLWGEDAELAQWLSQRGIRCRRFAADNPTACEVILASGKPADAPALAALARHIAKGSTVVFLTPEALLNPDNDGKVLPRPSIGQTPVWYFRADHWAKDHPIFDGLPCGGIMDYRFYRDLLSERVFSDLPPPAEAVCGVIQASGGGDYHSNLIVSVHDMAPGRLILNSLRIRENLGKVPAAERLLRNMLNFAAELPSTGAPRRVE